MNSDGRLQRWSMPACVVRLVPVWQLRLVPAVWMKPHPWLESTVRSMTGTPTRQNIDRAERINFEAECSLSVYSQPKQLLLYAHNPM